MCFELCYDVNYRMLCSVSHAYLGAFLDRRWRKAGSLSVTFMVALAKGRQRGQRMPTEYSHSVHWFFLQFKEASPIRRYEQPCSHAGGAEERQVHVFRIGWVEKEKVLVASANAAKLTPWHTQDHPQPSTEHRRSHRY